MESEGFMQEALKLAIKAFNEREVPVGAIIVYQNKIIASASNKVEQFQDATAHAEVLAIKEAQNQIKNWRLKGCALYTTLEPCLMCYGASILSRVDMIVFGAPDLRHGACGGCYHLHDVTHPIHQPTIIRGVLQAESQALLKDFFKKVRDEHRNIG